jgi:hypothetical protein
MFAATSLSDLCRSVAEVDVTGLGPVELAGVVRGFAAARAAFDAAEARLLGELETSGVCDRFGSKTASWVAHETRAARGSVQARVRVGVALAHRFASVDVALTAGVITFDHSRAFVSLANPRVVDQIADLQEVLIERAQDRPFHIWRSELALLVELLDADGPFDPNRDLARNRLQITEVAPGEILFSGMLVGEHALRFVDAIGVESSRGC